MNRLFIDFKHAVFVGQLGTIKHHKHTTGALCISLDKNIVIRSGAAEYRSRVFYIPQHTDIEMRCDSPIVIYCIELNKQHCHDLRVSLGIDTLPVTSQLRNAISMIDAARTLYEEPTLTPQIVTQFITRLGIDKTASSKADPRIEKVIAMLQAEPACDFRIEALTEYASMSKSRLCDLFKASTGLTIRRYRIWQRLMLAAHLVSKGHNLTDCAHHAGFSDSAHLSNSCRKLLGLSPLDLLSQPLALQISTGMNTK